VDNGIEAYTEALKATLIEAGIAVRMLHRGVPESPEDRHLGGRGTGLQRFIGPFASTLLGNAIAEAAEEYQADVVHCTYPEYAARHPMPTVTTFWHPQLSPWQRVRSRADHSADLKSELTYALNDRFALRRTSVAIALTRPVHAALVRHGADCVLMPAFLSDARVQAVQSPRPAICIMVARYLDAPRKGLSRAIAAAEVARRRHPDLRLILVGEFAAPEAARRLPEFCSLTGVLGDTELDRVLRSAGCLLVPSLWEEFGYVVLEGLAAGVPVVSGPLDIAATIHSDGLLLTDWDNRMAGAEAITKALAIGAFDFPSDCRSSNASRRLAETYERAIQEHRKTSQPS
jgi:glycosyltransferase involved in cell wall biosynthesis